jgi:hypothetical protein
MSFSLNTYVIATSTIAMIGTFLDFFEINLRTLTGIVNKGAKQVPTTEQLGGGGKRKQTKTRKSNKTIKHKYSRKK